MATNEWFTMFPRTKIHHLDTTTSDHKPLWIAPESMDSSFQKPFYFKQMLMMNKGYSDTIEAVWTEKVANPWDIRVLKKFIRVELNYHNGVRSLLEV